MRRPRLLFFGRPSVRGTRIALAHRDRAALLSVNSGGPCELQPAPQWTTDVAVIAALLPGLWATYRWCRGRDSAA